MGQEVMVEVLSEAWGELVEAGLRIKAMGLSAVAWVSDKTATVASLGDKAAKLADALVDTSPLPAELVAGRKALEGHAWAVMVAVAMWIAMLGGRYTGGIVLGPFLTGSQGTMALYLAIPAAFAYWTANGGKHSADLKFASLLLAMAAGFLHSFNLRGYVTSAPLPCFLLPLQTLILTRLVAPRLVQEADRRPLLAFLVAQRIVIFVGLAAAMGTLHGAQLAFLAISTVNYVALLQLGYWRLLGGSGAEFDLLDDLLPLLNMLLPLLFDSIATHFTAEAK